jgi:hypothetical protein
MLFKVIEDKLTDKSPVFSVQGWSANHNPRWISIDCDTPETAATLAELLNENTFGVQITPCEHGS